MAVKYTRDGFRTSAHGLHHRQDLRPGFLKLDPRRRFLVVYIGVCFLILAIALFDSRMRRRFEDQPVRRGRWQVVDKKTLEVEGVPPRYFVQIRMAVATGPDLEKLVRIDPESYQQTRTGDFVMVDYQLSRDGKHVKLHRVQLESDQNPIPENGDQEVISPPE